MEAMAKRRTRYVSSGVFVLVLLAAAAFVIMWAVLPPPGAMDCLERAGEKSGVCWNPVSGCKGVFEGFASRHEPVEFQFNSRGYRGPLPTDPPAALRIGVFGASTIFGYGLTEQETWREHTLKALLRLMPDRTVELFNFGVAGYDVRQQLAHAGKYFDLDLDLLVFTVDAHLLMPTNCDAWWATCSAAANRLPPLRWYLLRKARAMEAPSKEPTMVTLFSMVKWHVVHPDLPVALFFHSPIGSDDQHQSLVATLAQGFKIIDLHRELEEMFNPESPDSASYWLDNMEGWSARGHALIGDLLAEKLAGLLGEIPK